MATPHGMGSIVQLDKGRDGRKPKSKCRKWRLVVCTGRDPRTKKYRQKSRTFNGSYSEAEKELRRFHDELDQGESPTGTAYTFDAYVDLYIDARVAAGELRPSSASAIRGSLLSMGHHIGSMKLHKVTPADIEAAYAGLRNGDSRSGKCLSSATVNHISISTYLLFEHARKNGIITRNPLDPVPMPRKENRPKRAMDPAEYREFIARLDPAHNYQCAVLLCASVGMRRAETVALDWGSVDFAKRTIDVCASCYDDGEMTAPKTEAGYRLLPMSDDLAKALMRRKAALVADLARWAPEKLVELQRGKGGRKPRNSVEHEGKVYDVRPDVAVAADDQGNRPSPRQLSHYWKYHRKEFETDWSLHELRHTFLTLAAASGVHPSVMQQLAGHKSAATSLDIYTHVNMDTKRDALAAIQSLTA